MTNSFLLRLNRTAFLLSGIGFSIVIVLLYAIIVSQAEISNPNINYSTVPDIIKTFITAVIITPFLETIVFQTFIHWLINKLLKTQKLRNTIFLIISSVAFGCSHYYSLDYIIYTTIVGFLLAFYYIISIKRTESPIKNIFIIHACFNLILITGGIILYLSDNNNI